MNEEQLRIGQRPAECSNKVSALTNWIFEPECASCELTGVKSVPVVFQVMWEGTRDQCLSLRVFCLITAPPLDADIQVAQELSSKKTSMTC